MRKLLLMAAALCALAGAAKADFVLNPTQVGQSGVVNYNGIVEGNPVGGLTASITFTLNSVDLLNNIWNFGFDVTNTSVAPIGSRVSTFGFNTDPNFDAASITGGTVFDTVSSGNVPGFMSVEFCATAGANCAGGAGGGALSGGSSVGGSFALDFAGSATLLTQIAFSDLYVRYQSITGTDFGTSGIGLNGGPTQFCTTPPCTFAVPGPLVGAGAPGIAAALGLLGFNYWRRRRRFA